jgi:hypothetical protein
VTPKQRLCIRYTLVRSRHYDSKRQPGLVREAKKMEKIYSHLPSSGSSVVEQSSHYLKLEGSNLAAAGAGGDEIEEKR